MQPVVLADMGEFHERLRHRSRRLPSIGSQPRARRQRFGKEFVEATDQRICAVLCHQAVFPVDDSGDLRLMRRQYRLAEGQGPLRQAAVLAFPGRNDDNVAGHQQLVEFVRRKVAREAAAVRETRN